MFPNELWPPLELVEAALEGIPASAQDDGQLQIQQGATISSLLGSDQVKASHAAYLMLPLTELAQRRAAVAEKSFSIGWASGRLVQMSVNGTMLGVLLDRVIQGKQWTGWMAGNESNWAGAFDVLLEPCDDPFEPMFGVIQAWNPITLHWSEDLQAKVVCEVSAIRLAAIRAVSLEYAAGLMIPTPPEPGRIALRTAGGTFSVLTGTPLGPQDVRHDYQNAYRTVAARLMTQQLTQRLSQIERKNLASRVPQARVKRPSGWTNWTSRLTTGRYMQLALAFTAMIFLLQNLGSLTKVVATTFNRVSASLQSHGQALTAAPPKELRVQWKSGASMDEVQNLLRAASIGVMDGPDHHGFYRLESNDVSATLNALHRSGLVLQVATP